MLSTGSMNSWTKRFGQEVERNEMCGCYWKLCGKLELEKKEGLALCRAREDELIFRQRGTVSVLRTSLAVEKQKP